jgi:hypothetical protein
MNIYTVNTKSESCDYYCYHIQSDKDLTDQKNWGLIEEWLLKNGSDFYEDELYENIQDVYLVSVDGTI